MERPHQDKPEEVSPHLFQSPTKSPETCGPGVHRSPRTPRTPRTTPSGEEGLSDLQRVLLRASPFRSPSNPSSDATPTKHLQSPLKGILRTPIKDLGLGPSSSGLYPVGRTPRKSVTWSPHQRDGTLVHDGAFKVPESPQTPQRLKPGSGLGSPAENTSRNLSRTPEQQSRVAAVDGSGGVSSQRFSEESEEATSQRSAEPPGEPKSPGPPHRMNTRSGRSPSRPKDEVGSPADSLRRKRRSDQGVGTRAGSRVPSAESLNWSGSCPAELLLEPSESSDGGSGSSQLNSTEESLDIVDAAVTKTQFTGGLKINISFSRKNSQPAAPGPGPASGTPPGRSYVLRQTPDRRQREAAARLGYGNQPPRSSTPRSSAAPGPQKLSGSPNLRSYQVEMEMQTSGVPKLRLKRTDSRSAADSGAASPAAGPAPQLDSPPAVVSRQRDPGGVSPSVCAHTPAKSTCGKALQTFICQSYTPTRLPGGTAPPVAVAETVPLTPSPQGLGKMPPDHLNSWPRRKRAQARAAGGKERPLVEAGDEAELGVRRLQDVEDVYPAASGRAPLEDFYWMDQLALQADPQTEEPATHDSRAGETGEGHHFSLTDPLVSV